MKPLTTTIPAANGHGYFSTAPTARSQKTSATASIPRADALPENHAAAIAAANNTLYTRWPRISNLAKPAHSHAPASHNAPNTAATPGVGRNSTAAVIATP